MNDSLASIQYITYFVIIIFGVGLQWGIMVSFRSSIKKELELMKHELDGEIKELKRRANVMEEKLPEILSQNSEMKAILNAARSTMDLNFERIFKKFDDQDRNIQEFYRNYGKSLNKLSEK